MVKGLDVFKEYFQDYADNYIIIGGSACDVIIEEEGLTPRATKDIDMILVVEALNAAFVKQFWKFIEEGDYERKEKNEEDRTYYRFINPRNQTFPVQVELFSRNPDLMDLDGGTTLTPIPVDDDLTSLSAILLDEEYYKYLRKHSVIINEVHLANYEALICLKARAYLDLTSRGAESRKIKKHKTDVFRMTVLLSEEDQFELPESIKKDMQKFVDAIADDLPGEAMYKRMGVGAVDSITVFQRLKANFLLK
jgi:hypothetical protein